jgi:hypothetical protein
MQFEIKESIITACRWRAVPSVLATSRTYCACALAAAMSASLRTDSTAILLDRA